MWRYVFYVYFLSTFCVAILWNADRNCPTTCTCRLEHLTETAIYRFIQNKHNKPAAEAFNTMETNEVIYEENLEMEILQDKPIVRSAICILQTETDPSKLMKLLPKDIETLTLIQGFNLGNKTVKFSELLDFHQLISLELLGPSILNKAPNSHLFSEIDQPLPNLKYFSLEKILIKNSKNQIQNFVKEINETELTFEYIQKFSSKAHPLTMIQQGNEEIIPYEKYKEEKTYKIPLFFGFKSLILLRINSCELNLVHWEMFEGLLNLEYLILEKNNLRFIPPFAFYGTPTLKILSLAHNNLLDIQLTDLAGLLELAYLDLSYNNFSQLSELSLPPFPKLKLADFANNPITVIFPNTFEVMNTTDSLIIGSYDMPLSLTSNSFLGLDLLKVLSLINLDIVLLKRELLVGMPNLKEFIVTGKIVSIEYDAFLDVYRLEKLTMKNCKMQNISIDSFIGLERLKYLDLSHNLLEYIPPAAFDQLLQITELYLNGNNFKQLPRDLFARIHPKLLRLNENPWHCTCYMSEWKPMVVNKNRQRSVKPCNRSLDKGLACKHENRLYTKYVYDNKIAPKCSTPKQYENWSVFHVMRKLLKCSEYKPKLRKHKMQNKYQNKFNRDFLIKYSNTVSNTIDKNSFETRRLVNKSPKLFDSKLRPSPIRTIHDEITRTESNSLINSKYFNNDDNNINIQQPMRENTETFPENVVSKLSAKQKYMDGMENQINSML